MQPPSYDSLEEAPPYAIDMAQPGIVRIKRHKNLLDWVIIHNKTITELRVPRGNIRAVWRAKLLTPRDQQTFIVVKEHKEGPFLVLDPLTSECAHLTKHEIITFENQVIEYADKCFKTGGMVIARYHLFVTRSLELLVPVSTEVLMLMVIRCLCRKEYSNYTRIRDQQMAQFGSVVRMQMGPLGTAMF